MPWAQCVEAFQKHFETSNSLSLSLSDPLTRAVVSSIGPILVWSKSLESVPLSTFFNFQRTVYRLYKIIRSSPTDSKEENLDEALDKIGKRFLFIGKGADTVELTT